MTLIYREMRASDRHSQRELFRASFPEASGTPAEGPAHYEWKFHAFPSGRARHSYEYVAEEDGVTAAYYAALPYPYSISNRSVTAGMVCDVMTHPDFRGRGLFTGIGHHATAALGQEGVAFVTGYPIRPEVVPGHLKVGWKVVQPLPVWLRPTGSRTILPAYLRWAHVFLDPLVRLAFAWTRPEPGYRTEIVSRDQFLSNVAYSPGYRFLLERWMAGVPNALKKDADFLAWRTGAPGAAYEFALLYRGDVLAGVAVMRQSTLKGVSCIALLDVMIDPQYRSGATALHHSVAQHAVRMGCDGVACMCSRERATEYRFRRSGYLRTPATFSLIVKRLTSQVSDEEVYDAQRWHVFWLDSDDL